SFVVQLAASWTLLARARRERGGDVRAALERAQQLGARAAELDAGDATARLAHARLELASAEWDRARGRDPSAALERARAATERGRRSFASEGDRGGAA